MNKLITGRHPVFRVAIIAALFAVVCVAAATPQRAARAEQDQPLCSQGSLQGSFGYLITGSVGQATTSATSKGAWTSYGEVAAGLITFDGAGGLIAKDTLSANTSIGPTYNSVSHRDGVGTYTVGNYPTAPCMGSASIDGDFAGLSFDFMIVPGSHDKELTLVITNPGQFGSGVATSTGDEPCSNSSLSGVYRVLGGGANPISGPTAAAGFRVLDGAGNLTYAEDTINRNGTITHRPGRAATYTVFADCSASEAFTDGATFEGVVVAGGHEAYFVRTGGVSAATAMYKR